MTALKNWIRSEFILGMKAYDYIFMALMVMLQIVVFCIKPDSWVSIVAGIAGVISVVLCAQGKISFYFIGFIFAESLGLSSLGIAVIAAGIALTIFFIEKHMLDLSKNTIKSEDKDAKNTEEEFF